MLYPVLNMDAMTAHRKRRLAELIQRRFDGAQVAFARAAGLSEGRVALEGKNLFKPQRWLFFVCPRWAWGLWQETLEIS